MLNSPDGGCIARIVTLIGQYQGESVQENMIITGKCLYCELSTKINNCLFSLINKLTDCKYIHDIAKEDILIFLKNG